MTTTSRNWLTTAIGITLLAFMLFPIYWMVNASLQPSGSALQAGWFPWHPDVSGYLTALHDQGQNLVTSLVVSLASVLVCLVFAAPAAYALSRFALPGTPLVLLGILLTQMVPGNVVANALYGAYNDLGLLNSYLGLVLADASHALPFAILILRAFMQGIPQELIDAAHVDGAGRLRVFRSVVLPMSVNSLITAALFAFLFAWGDFLFAVTLTTSNAIRPITVGIYQYIGASQANDWSAVMATAVLASLPAGLLLVLAQRHIAAGVTTGALK